MKIRGSRILVTGAGGLIGGALAVRLVQEGATVRALVRHPAPDLPGGVEICEGDLANDTCREEAVGGCDAVVHAAARHIARGPRAEFDAINVSACEQLVFAFSRSSPTRQRFLHVSTINVHGLPPPPNAHAGSPLLYSGDAYSDSKVDGERRVWQAAVAERVPVTVVRPACTYGPRGKAWTLLPLERLRRGRPVLFGKGDGMCNAIYIDNLIELLVRALENDAAVGQAFIGGEGQGVPWSAFYTAYARMLGVSARAIPLWAARGIADGSALCARLLRRPQFSRRANFAFYTHRVVFDIGTAARLLGYVPTVSFEEGMARTEAWLRAANLVPAQAT